jgi:hypothetical protein
LFEAAHAHTRRSIILCVSDAGNTRPKGRAQRALEIVGVLALLGVIVWLRSLPEHVAPPRSSTIFVARLTSDLSGSVSRASVVRGDGTRVPLLIPPARNIPLAVNEDTLEELADAFDKTDWIEALKTSGSVFSVYPGTRLALLDRNTFHWSFTHWSHIGTALKVRVIDDKPPGNSVGRVGYLLSGWLDQSGFSEGFANKPVWDEIDKIKGTFGKVITKPSILDGATIGKEIKP